MASIYEIEILNKFGEEDIYVDFLIHDRILGKTAHCCNWYDGDEARTNIEIIEDIYKERENWFKLPKTTELSDITYSIFKDLCQSEDSMLWIDNDYSRELYNLNIEENIQILKLDIQKFHLDDYIEFDGNDIITVYGGLQTLFNDNRELGDYKRNLKIHFVSKDFILEKIDLMYRKNESGYDLVIFQNEDKFFAIDDTTGRCSIKVFDSLDIAAMWLLDGKLSISEYKKLDNPGFIQSYIVDETKGLRMENSCEL